MEEPLPPKKTEVEETLQFLKREEVRTMAKDVAKLREQEATKERERITDIKTEPQQALQTQGAKLKPSLMPHAEKPRMVLPKARTRFEKILIRLVVAGILIFILSNGIAFGYWYFIKKRGAQITPSPQPSPEAMAGEAEPGNGNQVSTGNLVSPTPIVFFETPQEKTVDAAATDNLLLLLSNVLKEEHQQGFTRILFKKQGGDAFLTTKEFLTRTNLVMPGPLLSLLKEDFMVFVYSSPGRKRLGFIAELSQTDGAQDMLKGWETTLQQDTKPLWEIVGQKGSAYTPFFRQTAYQNNVVRFQTFSVIDFGVVYTLFGTKLILATSFESVTKAVDLLIQSRP